MRTPTRRSVVGAVAVLAATMATAAPAVADDGGRHHDDHRARGTLLQADLVGSLTTDAPLFGVLPGGADWSVSRSTVRVKADGRVDVRVRHLVLTSTGANPVPRIAASLVCNGALVDTVGPVAYSTSGDARIKDTFTVPDRCLAPAVLLHPANPAATPEVRLGTYIAASGQAG